MKKELHATNDMLEILFAGRNKAYGAYAIRKGYPNTLLKALLAGLLVLFLLLMAAGAGARKKAIDKPVLPVKEGIVIRTIELPKEKIVKPEKPATAAKPIQAKKTATVKFTAPLIKKDEEVKEIMPAMEELAGKDIAEKTMDGVKADNLATPVDVPVGVPVEEPGTGVKTEKGPVQPVFVAEERDPQFPGGQEGLKKFMAQHLGSPGYLEGGEKKLVMIRFVVEKDGTVSGFRVVSSGGEEYDKEVVRVVRKMPRWLPAVQNGMNVSVHYVLPVTFIGTEE